MIMEYRENGSRFKQYSLWESKKQDAYDYENKGLLKYILSNRIVNSENEILQKILKYYEYNIVFVLKYIDRLKHFKNYHWKNR